MFEYLKITRCPLILDGEEIGCRYLIFFGDDRKYAWDMDGSVEPTLLRCFKKNDISIHAGKPITGFMDGNIFKTRSEWGVTEIDSVDTLKTSLKGMTDLYQKYLLLVEKFEVYVARLKTKLRDNGVSGWLESRVDYDRLTWSCRFIGGFGAWSSAGEDICDAEVLDNKVGRVIDNVVKELRKTLDKNVELYWQTGEKAWCYFKFE